MVAYLVRRRGLTSCLLTSGTVDVIGAYQSTSLTPAAESAAGVVGAWRSNDDDDAAVPARGSNRRCSAAG